MQDRSTDSPLSSLLKPGPAASAAVINVDRMLHAIRTHLGMDVAFVTEFRARDRVFTHVDAQDRSPIRVGDVAPLSTGYCQRVVDGRLPELIDDTGALPAAAALPETAEIPIGAHVSVPIRLSDGSVYGTFCCFSFLPDTSLTDRDLQIMKAFAELLAAQIDQHVMTLRRWNEQHSRIWEAIELSQPSIVFQPVYDLAQQRITGAECLARFQCTPTRAPDAWFAEAAAVGMGSELEASAVQSALRSLHDLPDDFYLAINASPDFILSGALAPMLEPIDLKRIVLEITEHARVSDYDALTQALRPLRNAGMRVAIDDAGAGYSSMRHILHIEPELVKLDISLTRGIDADPKRRALASALIAFARETGTAIVAEGVETQAELQALLSLGVTSVQGYLLGRPMTLAELQRCVSADTRRSTQDKRLRMPLMSQHRKH
jgi:EAL domain-containing protein (putative c-di-GMP-specific phosphodiesterase class I)